jgi:hypothetical protein
MNEPVPHKAEVALEYDFALFAEILGDLANTVASLQLEALREGAKALYLPLGPGALHEEELTPDLEVRLLHLLD